jgi:hypothetical protein
VVQIRIPCRASDGAWLDPGPWERLLALQCRPGSRLIRGLGDALAREFQRELSPTADALCYADMTTGPDGQDLEMHARLAEIRRGMARNTL